MPRQDHTVPVAHDRLQESELLDALRYFRNGLLIVPGIVLIRINLIQPLHRVFHILFLHMKRPPGGGPGKNASHNHHFKWWFGITPQRAPDTARLKRRVSQASLPAAAHKRPGVSSFLDSSDCSSMYFFIAASVTLPIVAT